jgi:hypothetical protein
MRVRVLSPLIAGLSAVADQLLFSGELLASLLAFVVTTLDQWLPVLSMVSSYVAPQTAVISQEMIQEALFWLALLLVGIQTARIFDNWRENNA